MGRARGIRNDSTYGAGAQQGGLVRGDDPRSPPPPTVGPVPPRCAERAHGRGDTARVGHNRTLYRQGPASERRGRPAAVRGRHARRLPLRPPRRRAAARAPEHRRQLRGDGLRPVRSCSRSRPSGRAGATSPAMAPPPARPATPRPPSPCPTRTRATTSGPSRSPSRSFGSGSGTKACRSSPRSRSRTSRAPNRGCSGSTRHSCRRASASARRSG